MELEKDRSNPILMIGTARSGTNLLARILDMHSRMRVPYPLHLMQALAGLQSSYGNLTDDKQMLALIDDARLLAANHTVPWKNVHSAQSVLEALPQRSVFGVMAALWELDTRAAGKKRWCDRSIGMIEYVDAVRSVYPGVRLVWLVRDPRDVAASARGSVFLPFHPELTARLWQRQQEQGMELARTLPDSVHLLKYEDLIADPATSVKQLCEFLGEDYEPRMLDYFRDAEAQRLAGLSQSWTNLREPVLSNNARKYISQFSGNEIAAIEAICASTMQHLGYLPTQPSMSLHKLSNLGHRCLVLAADVRMRLKVEMASVRNEKSHWSRWRRTFLVHWITQRQRLRGLRYRTA